MGGPSSDEARLPPIPEPCDEGRSSEPIEHVRSGSSTAYPGGGFLYAELVGSLYIGPDGTHYGGWSAPRDVGRCLVLIHGQEPGRKHDIGERELTIGRATESDIHVNDDHASPIHASITVDDTSVRIRDNGSEHGTFVNGVAVHDTRLENGDIITVGCHRLELLMGEDIERMYQEVLYRLSTVDGLTQLFNRRYFTDTLLRELKRAHRYDRPLALVMLGIDGFAACNDSFGARAGDHVLQQLATLVCDGSRKVDVVARYGKDVLTVILPELELDAAMKHVEAFREAVAQTRFEFEGRPIPLTLSLGVAELAPDVTDADDFVRLAETRMARAKTLGGNRVIASDAPTDPPQSEPSGSPS